MLMLSTHALLIVCVKLVSFSAALIDSTVPSTLSIFNASYPTVPTDTSITEPGLGDSTCKFLVDKTLE
jgi:hypothetical protein